MRSAAGIDHDYNFLHGIELSLERSEKLLIEEKGLVRQEELRPTTTQQIRWKTGRDGKSRRVLVTRVMREAKGRTIAKGLAKRLKQLNVRVVRAPSGMSRQRENNTTLNVRTGRINWQVEWMYHDSEVGQKNDAISRILSKVMDDVPIFEAYFAALEESARKGGAGQSRKDPRATNRPSEAQSCTDSRWHYGVDCAQDCVDGKWTLFSGGHLDEWPAIKQDLQRKQFRFFLANTRTASDEATHVTALGPEDCLREILRNSFVFEFPTIHVFRLGCALPQGFVLGGPKDARRPKRKIGWEAERASKRGKLASDREDGEVGSGSSSEDDDGEVAGNASWEVGEVIAEESLGEEDDEDDDDDDDTSSSGTGSEDD